jgi:hypothetical protein
MKNTFLNTVMVYVLILIFNSVSFADMMHPSIVGAPSDYRYKTVAIGQTIYIKDQNNKKELLVLGSFPEDLGFKPEVGVRLIQTSQLHKSSAEKIQLLTLRSAFVPNFAVAYNENTENEIPHWLKKNFMATKSIITTVDRRTGSKGPEFRVYEYMGSDEQVTLGGNGTAENMYLILVRSGRSEIIRR